MKRFICFLMSFLLIAGYVSAETQKAIDGKQYWFSEVLKVEKGVVVCGDIDIAKSKFTLIINGSKETPSKAFIWRNSDGSLFYRVRLDQGEKTLQFTNGKKFLVSTDSLFAVDSNGMLVSGWVSTPKEPFAQESVGPGLGVLLDGSETQGSIYVSTIPTNFMGTDGNFCDVYYFWNGLQPGARVSDGLIVAPSGTLIQGKPLSANTGMYFQIDNSGKLHIPFIGNVNNLGKKIPSSNMITLKTITGEEYAFSLSRRITLDDSSQLVIDGYVVNATIKLDGIEKKIKSGHYQVDDKKVSIMTEVEY